MNKKSFKGVIPGGLALLIFWFVWMCSGISVQAAPAPEYTTFPTPTPGPSGKIVYIAQANDSAWRIAAIFGIDLNQLRTLNKWGENPNIRPGDEIILGYAGPAEATLAPGQTPTPSLLAPTVTTAPGWGILCVILYNDLNGDSMRQETEPSIPRGAISLTNREGTVTRSEKTAAGSDPQCFQELPEGSYTVSIGVPDGYNPTTIMNRSITLKAGDITYLPFGAQANTQTVVQAPVPRGSGNNPILGITGGLLLVAGFVLALFAGRLLGSSRRTENEGK